MNYIAPKHQTLFGGTNSTYIAPGSEIYFGGSATPGAANPTGFTLAVPAVIEGALSDFAFASMCAAAGEKTFNANRPNFKFRYNTMGDPLPFSEQMDDPTDPAQVKELLSGMSESEATVLGMYDQWVMLANAENTTESAEPADSSEPVDPNVDQPAPVSEDPTGSPDTDSQETGEPTSEEDQPTNTEDAGSGDTPPAPIDPAGTDAETSTGPTDSENGDPAPVSDAIPEGFPGKAALEANGLNSMGDLQRFIDQNGENGLVSLDGIDINLASVIKATFGEPFVS